MWQWPYSAFGNNKPTGVLAATTSTGQQTRLKATKPPVAGNLRFAGQYFDEESNLSYNYFRSYSANIGRYSQVDPVGLEGGLNPFSYVAGNPLTYIDPRGLDHPGMGPYEYPSRRGPIIRMTNVDGKTLLPLAGTRFSPPNKRPDGLPWGDGCGDASNDENVPDSYLTSDFMPACRKHDQCYGTCGSSKAACDQRFLNDLIAACTSNPLTASLGCLSTAALYRAAMALPASRRAFKNAQSEACSTCRP